MPTLRDIQRDLAHSVMGGDDAVAVGRMLGHVAEGAAAERLNIYRNNVAMSLVRALRATFPAIDRLVGPTFFDGAARAFIVRCPPRTACLDDYGGEFPGFLAGFAAAAALVYLPDVARLEWAVNRALHAPDAPALPPGALAGVAGHEHGRVAFVRHPSVRLLAVRYPVEAIWRAVLGGDEAALGGIAMTDQPRWLLVQRMAAGIAVAGLDEDEARWTDLMFSGAALGELTPDDGGRFVALLADHLARGRFTGFSVEPQCDCRKGV